MHFCLALLTCLPLPQDVSLRASLATPLPDDYATHAIVDWDGDGIEEVLVFGDTVRLYEFNADLDLVLSSAIPGGSALSFSPTEVSVVDLDQDGFSDIVAWKFNRLQVAYGDSSGGLTAGPSFAVVSVTDTVVADMNGDGLLDIMTLGGPSLSILSQLYLWRQLQPRQWSTASQLTPLEQHNLTVTALDVDCDGDLDAVYGGSPGLRVAVQGAGGTFTSTPVNSQGVFDLQAADLDADGATDLLTTFYSQTGFELYTCAADGSGLGSPTLIDVPGQSIQPDHLDPDEHLDLVIRSDRRLRILKGTGLGLFSLAHEGTSPWCRGHADSIDIDGDGFRELLLFSGASLVEDVLTIDLPFQDGSCRYRTAETIPFTSASLVPGDFNGDGYEDYLSAAGTVASVLMGSPNGQLTRVGTNAESAGNKEPVVLDYNLDGHLDSVTGGGGFFPVLQFGLGDGTFSLSPPSPLTPGVVGPPLDTVTARTVLLRDFGADGSVEMATFPSGVAQALTLWRYDGSGGVFTVGTFPLALSAKWGRFADVDQDGVLDVVYVESSTGSLVIQSGVAGPGMFDAPTVHPQLVIDAFEFGDLNGDGLSDVVGVPVLSGQPNLAYALQQPSGSFGSLMELLPDQQLSFYTALSDIRMADLDGNGHVDVLSLTRHGVLRVNYSDGLPSTTPTLVAATIPDAVSMLPADLGGDGRIDLIVSSGHHPGSSGNCEGDLLDDVTVLRNDALYTPELYCTATPNSDGSVTLMSWAGEPSLSANTLELVAAPLPSPGVGLFILGTAEAQTPFGPGVRCVGGGFSRTPTQFTAGTGFELRQSMSLGLWPGSSGSISVGSTRYAQAWYRDPGQVVAPFNTSNGLSVTYGP